MEQTFTSISIFFLYSMVIVLVSGHCITFCAVSGCFSVVKNLTFAFFSPSDDNESAVKRGYLANEYDFQGMKT